MYRRVVLTLYGGCRSRATGALTVTRYTDHTLKCFSLGNVHCSENKPPKDRATSKPSRKGKKSPKVQLNAKPAEDAPNKKDTSQPPQKETLQNIISGMKVEVSSSKKLIAAKRASKVEKKWAVIRDGVESASKMFQKASKRTQPEEKEAVGPEMAAAVSAVASTFPDKKEVESELLQHLLRKQTGKKEGQKDLNISQVISGMQIKPESKTWVSEETRQRGEIERMFSQRPRKRSRSLTGKRLNIFPVSRASEETTITVAESSPTLWDLELAKELATACEQPLRNGFEEMIQWTNEGKLWTFPINNEAGLDEEQDVEFHEHIFLDRYLEDFPKQGPIRHFMELVVCGLSKNPFLTVQQKKEHIDWFRDYFKQKEEILKECNVYLN